MSVGRAYSLLLWLFAGIGCAFVAMAEAEQGSSRDRELLAQKVMLLDNLLTRTKSSERYSAVENQAARELVAEAEEFAGIAKENLKQGDLEVAAQGLDEAFQRMFTASRMCKKETGSTLVEQMRYQELLEGIGSLQTGADIGIDPAAEKLVQDARVRAEQDDYAGAIGLLSQAYEMVAAAVAHARDKQTLVYSLDFATPEEEYDYEVRRYSGNQMIIDLLLEKHPGSTAALVKNFVAKAEEMREAAGAKATEGRFGEAVRDMEAAGKHQQRAMRLLGIQS